MALNCANPNCSAEFLNLYESEWIMIELPDRMVQQCWLCGSCSQYFRVVYDSIENRVKVLPKDGSEKAKQGTTECRSDSFSKAA